MKTCTIYVCVYMPYMHKCMCVDAWDSVADVDVVEAVVDEVQLRRRCQARRYYRQYHLCVCVCVCVCVCMCVLLAYRHNYQSSTMT